MRNSLIWKRNAQLMSENRYNAAFKNEILSHERVSIRAATCSCHSPFNKQFKFIVSIGGCTLMFWRENLLIHSSWAVFHEVWVELSEFDNFNLDCVIWRTHREKVPLHTVRPIKVKLCTNLLRDSGCFVYCVRCSFPLWIGCCETVAFSYQKSLRLNGTVFWIVLLLLHKFDRRIPEHQACKQFEYHQVFNVF